MNKMKKTGITMLAVAICVLLSVTVLAVTLISVDISATANETLFCTSGAEQTVTVTIKAEEQIDVASIDGVIVLPDNWEIDSIIIDGKNLPAEAFDPDNNRLMWFSNDSTNKSMTNLIEINVKIPADVSAGVYEVSVVDVELAKLVYENNQIKDVGIYTFDSDLTVEITVVECEDNSKDHECDYGCGKTFGICEDKDLDHDCDYGCNKVYGTCEDKDFDHDCEYG